MIILATDPVSGHARGRPRARSSYLGHPTRSSNDEEAYGSCRTCGKRKDRVSHEILGRRTERAAHNAPQAIILRVFRMKNEEHTITAPDERRKETEDRHPLVASLR
jgi:hypothetical protein